MLLVASLVSLTLLCFASTEATSLGSQIFKDLASHSVKLEELTIRCEDEAYVKRASLMLLTLALSACSWVAIATE